MSTSSIPIFFLLALLCNGNGYATRGNDIDNKDSVTPVAMMDPQEAEFIVSKMLDGPRLPGQSIEGKPSGSFSTVDLSCQASTASHEVESSTISMAYSDSMLAQHQVRAISVGPVDLIKDGALGGWLNYLQRVESLNSSNHFINTDSERRLVPSSIDSSYSRALTISSEDPLISSLCFSNENSSKEQIHENKHLLTSREFKLIAGKARISSASYGKINQLLSQYTDLMQQLKTYFKTAGCSDSSSYKQANYLRNNLLQNIQRKAQEYDTKEKKELNNLKIAEKVRRRLECRRQALDYLFAGIEKERCLIGGSPEHLLSPRSRTSSLLGGGTSQVTLIGSPNHRARVFKGSSEEEKMRLMVGAKMGIPDTSIKEANLMGRALAAYRVDQLLGVGLIPVTDAAWHEGKFGSAQVFEAGDPLYTEAIAPLSKEGIYHLLKGAFTHEDRELADGSFQQVLLTEDQQKEQIEAQCEEWIYDIAVHGGANGRNIPEGWSCIYSEALGKISENGVVLEAGTPIKEERALELYKSGDIKFGKKIVTSITDIDLMDPAVQKAASEAQLLGLLIGDIDRHITNILFRRASGDGGDGGDGAMKRKPIILIDCELTFPRLFDHLNEEVFAKIGGPALRKLPRLIDAEMASKIINLDPQLLKTALEVPLLNLTTDEIAATLQRLNELKDYIKHISNIPGGRLVEVWNYKTYEILCKKVDGKDDNYISRTEDDRTIKKEEMQQWARIQEKILPTIGDSDDSESDDE